MENQDLIICEKMEKTKINSRRHDEPVTGFAKDSPKVTRYSLADAVGENETSGMDYHIQFITKEDKPKVLKFLRRFFFRDEPLNHSIQLIPEGEDSTCIELEEYSMSALADNLSLMAVSSTGGIIGVQLNGKMEPPEDGEPEYINNCKNPKFRKILRLLHHVDKSASIPSRYPGQKVLEIRIISVDSNWRGRGVAGALIEKTVEIAQELGFHLIRSDCTSLFSGKLCKRYGFEPVYELKYIDYVDENGIPIFTPAKPHVSVMTYVKKVCQEITE